MFVATYNTFKTNIRMQFLKTTWQQQTECGVKGEIQCLYGYLEVTLNV